MNIADRSSWKRYLPDVDPTLQLGIRSCSWQEYELFNPSGLVTARSMLMLNEIALLFMLTKDYYSGQGEIVDLGPLLGVGTNALARGLARSSQRLDKAKRIHCFDLFLAKGMGPVIGESTKSGSVFDRFLHNTWDYMPHISVVPGNLFDMTWDRSPIEVLFIDIAKSWELNTCVVRRFVDCLIPGRSIVVQQDYVHFAEYWIPITMEVFRDYFEHLYFLTGSTSVYRYVREIPSHILYGDIQKLPIDMKIQYLERAIEKAPAGAREILKCSQAFCLLDHGQPQEAFDLLKTVQLSVPAAAEPTEDFSPLILSNARAVDDMLRARVGKSALANTDDDLDLRANLTVTLEQTEMTSKQSFRGTVHVKNIGGSPWAFVPAPTGSVNLGVHLLDATGETTVEHDYLRRRIGPASLLSLAPGDEIAFDIEVPAPAYGQYILEFDLVSEMICWFAQRGSRTVRIPIRVS